MESMIVFAFMALAFAMMPGPDFALVMKNTLVGGRKAGQLTAWGIVTGLLVHTTAAILGLSTLVAQSIVLFEMVKYIGAAYLFYLGIMALGKKKEAIQDFGAEGLTRQGQKFFRQAVIVNVMNPKVILFYLTFIPQFVDITRAVMPQFVLLGGIYIAIDLVWFLFLAYAMNHVKKLFTGSTFRSRMEKITGVLLISFGIKLALSDR